MKHHLFLIAILLAAAAFRFYGRNWDQGHHLHPDERFLTMVAMDLKWPKSLTEYLDAAASPLNPHNRGHNFYVYGTFPVVVTKMVSEALGQGDYSGLTLVGRSLSAVFDLGTLLLVFLITRRLFSLNEPALLASAIYALMVLPIQLSHFFAVDPYQTFFTILTFYLLVRSIKQKSFFVTSLVGVSYGLAISSKISSVLFVPVLGLGWLIDLFTHRRPVHFLASLALFIVSAYITVRLAQPYLFASPRLLSIEINPRVLENWRQLKSFENPNTWFPPATMWINSKAYTFPLENFLLWGTGLPLGLLSLASIPYVFLNYRRSFAVLTAIWTVVLFVYQGGQFVKPLRYFYVLYPFLAITAGLLLWDICRRTKLLALAASSLIFIWPLAFVSIYSRPHSRVTATNWILENISPGSSLSCEHWDDCLPLANYGRYRLVEFPLYLPDTPIKWQDMNSKLSQTDYIILSSNRLYGSIMTVPQKYPATDLYYQNLFRGSLGFTKVAEFTSRPRLPFPGLQLCLIPPGVFYGRIALSSQSCPLPGISFVDDYADESFTVYDHPKVIIFRKNKP